MDGVRKSRGCSDEPRLCKRKTAVVSDDDVIEKRQVKQPKRVAKRLGKFSVSGAGLSDPRWVVVGHDQRAGAGFERAAGNFARINHRLGNAARKHFFGTDQTVLAVEKQRSEAFAWALAQP